jgi:hypothetical protein
MIPFEDAGDATRDWPLFELVMPLNQWREHGYNHLAQNYKLHDWVGPDRIFCKRLIDGLVCVPKFFLGGEEHELGYYKQGVN